MTTSDNPYGREPEQRAEIIGTWQPVEPHLRCRATLELDGRSQPAALADIIERLAAHVP